MFRKIFVLSLVTGGLFAAAEEPVPASPEPPRGLAALSVPTGFTVELAAGPELSSYPMFMTFDSQDRLFIAESSGVDRKSKLQVADPDFMLLMLEDLNDDGQFDTRTVYADKLALPMGVLCYRGSVYAACPPDFVRFEDTDGDGVADVREVLLSGWNVLNTASLHGPFLGPDGWLYLTHGRHGYKIQTKEGETLEGMASRIWRCLPNGTRLDRMAGGGFDNPVELIFTDAGETIGTMTYFVDPKNGQRDALMHWVEGGVYPKPEAVTAEFTRTGELMPTMTKFARIAPAGLERYRGDAFGPAHKDNLFSAQFNPHRVQRHVLTRTGATFQTADSDFLTSSDPDFHPTDVLEDADGSLLVTDTGAWYVDACPISRVAKPEIKGGIYRIRKNGASMVEDPWGKKLELGKKPPNELVAFLADPRPRVRDHAVELLVEQGEKAVPAVSKLLKSGPDAGRNAAIWILGRINTSVARDAVRSALQDAAPAARIAAARLAGLNGDQGAVPALRENLRNEDPAVRRQAATALGQLKAADAVSDLLSAAAASADRFEEHAIIYALIQVGETGPLIAALDSRDDKDAKSNEDRRRDKAEGNPAVQKAALIALDQMPGSPLTREQFAPFLASNIEDLRKTALWVASHHADWSDVVLEFLQARLRTEDLDASALESLCEAVLAFAANTEIQTMLAALLQDSVLSDERRLFLLDTINRAPLTPFPESWVQTLGALLRSGSDQITVRAIGLLAARAIANFDQDLLALAADSSSSVPVRIAAITGADGRAGKLPAPLTQFLLGEVQQQEDASVRLAAAKALAVAKLDQGELRTLATELLPKADAMTLPALLDLFHENSDETVGLALVKSLEESGIKPNLIPGGLDALLTGFPAPVQEAAAPLRAQAEEESKARIERLVALEPFLGTGDVGRGRRIFFEDTANCHACHAVGNEGGTFGPDLTTIGTVRSAHDLLEAVLFPSASFVPDYEPYRIKTLDDIQAGVILRQSADAITLATGVNAETRIPRADIVEMTRHTVSIMPEGLDVSLSRQDLIDLITFLQSLNQEPWLLPSAVKPPSSQGF